MNDIAVDMNRIWSLRLDQMGFTPAELNVLRTEYIVLRNKAYTSDFGALTVADYMIAHGEWPRMNENYSNSANNKPYRSFVCLREKLIQLGVTPREWPLAAIKTKDVYQAHIDQCHGDKERIKLLSVLVLGVSREQMTYIYSTRKRRATAEDVLTIGTLLTFEILSEEIIFRDSPAFRRNVRLAREKLQQLGFDAQDGVFLKDIPIIVPRKRGEQQRVSLENATRTSARM